MSSKSCSTLSWALKPMIGALQSAPWLMCRAASSSPCLRCAAPIQWLKQILGGGAAADQRSLQETKMLVNHGLNACLLSAAWIKGSTWNRCPAPIHTPHRCCGSTPMNRCRAPIPHMRCAVGSAPLGLLLAAHDMGYEAHKGFKALEA